MGASESVVVDGTVEHRQKIRNSMRFDQAVISGNLSNVKAALKPDVDINKQYQLGQTVLIYACSKGYEDILVFLLEQGASMLVSDNGGNLPIHKAVWNNRIGVIRVLLRYRADILVTNSKRMTPLYLALLNGNVEIAELLLEHGANVKSMERLDDILRHVAYSGDCNVVQLLIWHGINLNVSIAKNRNQVLHHAAWYGHYKLVSTLLDNGAEKSCRGHTGLTALHMAALRNHLQVVDFLLDAGADTSAQNDNFLQQPLHSATSKGHTDIMIALLNHGANVTARDKNGLTPLHYAAVHDQYDAVKILLRYGADKSAKTLKGSLPVNLAKTQKVKDLINDIPVVSETTPSAPPMESNLPEELAEGYVEPHQTLLEKLEAMAESKTSELNKLKSQCHSLDTEIDEINKEIQSVKGNLQDDKASKLECPICFEIPKPPTQVYQCEEGHMFCGGCASYGITHCSECRVPLGNKLIRNRRLEEIIKDMF